MSNEEIIRAVDEIVEKIEELAEDIADDVGLDMQELINRVTNELKTRTYD